MCPGITLMGRRVDNMTKKNSSSLYCSIFLCLVLLLGCSSATKQDKKPVKQEGVADKKQPQEVKKEQPAAPAVAKADEKQDAKADEKREEKKDVKIPVSDSFARFKEKVELEKGIESERDFLFNNYLKTAKNYAGQNQYEDAYHFVLESLKLIPDHTEAVNLKKEYGRKLGFRPDEIADQMNDAVSMVKVKIEQTKVEIDNKIANGKRLLQQSKYDEAIASFKQAKEMLRWMPYHVADLEGKAKQVDFMIRRAEEENVKYKDELTRKRMGEAQEQARREEEGRLKTVREQIRTLFRQANLAFEREQYDLAESFCNQVAVLDPDNKDSKELVTLVQEARHSRMMENSRLKYLEEWKKIFEHIEDSMVPTRQIVQFPSYETWKQISKRRSLTTKIEEEEESPQDRKIREKLESETLTMDFTEAPLSEVVDFLRTATGINIIIDPEVNKEFPEEEALKVDLTVNKLKLNHILNLMLSLKRLAYRISNGVLIISTSKRIVEKPILRLYNVKDLTGKLSDFPAQELNLAAPTGGKGEGGGVQIEVEKTPAATTITEEQLTDLIKNNIAKGSWETEGRSIDTRHGTLIIRQINSVHKQIDALLNDLRDRKSVV